MSPEEPFDAARLDALSPLLTVNDFRPLSATVRADIGVRSHQGHVRETNDDHFLVVRLGREQETVATSLPSCDVPDRFAESAYAMVVADGLGETGAGATAGRVALSALAHLAIHFGRWNMRIDPHTAAEIKSRIEWLYRRVDEAVVSKSRSNDMLSGMATTLTAAYSAGDDLFVAHVGHSRAYLFRQGALSPLTRDHTLNSYSSGMSKPTPVDSGTRDLRHILTHTIGGDLDGPLVDVDHIRLLNGDSVLVCTNGLTDMVSDSRIAEVLASRRAASEQCRQLIDLALRNGGEDNVTAIVATYEIPPQ
jgi:PPM family protein phosphatase